MLEREGLRRPTELVSQTLIRASFRKVRMTMKFGPGCSVKKSAVSQAHVG